MIGREKCRVERVKLDSLKNGIHAYIGLLFVEILNSCEYVDSQALPIVVFRRPSEEKGALLLPQVGTGRQKWELNRSSS